MPIVRIELYEGRTNEQKADLAEAIIQAFQDVLGTVPSDVSLIYTDVKKNDWFFGRPQAPKVGN